MDYSKLDDRGIIKEGEYVDETTVIVGAYMTSTEGGSINDVSTAPQVWTRGRVEKVAVMVNNMGLRLVKIRVVQDRIPELGDKFSNRHGQKGTIGALLRAHDMPRTESGIVPDMIMNPHAIPSRMTIAQNLEQLLGKAAALTGAIGDGTSFMNDGSPERAIGGMLENFGFEKYGNEVMYNGATGEQIKAAIFIGPVYGMRLKHMVEDKWQARGQGRREVRTHQPTGGRGAQGGLKIGEMDRDAIIAHGGMSFVKESFMERSDGTKIPICMRCGTIPIYNPKLNIAICLLCDGPARFAGDTVNNLEILPPVGRPKSKIVEVAMPYSTKLLTQEQETYMNLTMRYITTSGVTRLNQLEFSGISSEIIKELPRLILPETVAPAYIEEVPKAVLTVEQLRSMGASVATLSEEEKKANDIILEPEIVQNYGEPMQQMQSIEPIEQMQQIEPMQSMQQIEPMQSMQSIEPVQQIQSIEQMQPMSGGLLPPSISGNVPYSGLPLSDEGIIRGPSVPGGGPLLVVRTDRDAMMSDGIIPEYGRQIRRNQFRGGQTMPMTPKYTPMEGSTNITITKLE
jgi:hypothetical protein